MDDIFNVRHDFRDILSDPSEVIWFFDAEIVHILKKISFPLSCELKVVDALEPRVVNNFIVDIGDVHSKLD